MSLCDSNSRTLNLHTIQTKKAGFREHALKKALETPNVDVEHLKLSLDIINTVGEYLDGEPISAPKPNKVRKP